jgi:hypothetical protein
MDEVNKQTGQLLPNLQRKPAQIGLMPLSREAARWVKETSQDLHRLHKPVVDARENPRPSLIAAELYGDRTELKEEAGLPSGAEGSDNSYKEAPPSQSHKVHSEDLATSLGRQQVPRGVACICTITVDNAWGEQDLETKPLKDLIAILQKGNPFIQHKHEAMQKRATRKKDRELNQEQWHFRKDGLLYHLQRLYCYRVVVDERTLCSTINNSVRQVRMW